MKYKSQISILLVIALIMGCMGWAPAKAQQVQEENMAPSVAETSQRESLTEDSKILDYVDSEQFLQSDHIARLPQEETLDSYVFLNRDGSKSIYYMGRPVKYVDENGSIREKDTTLVRGNGGYSMRDNDVALHIPDAAATGITMSHNKRTVKLIPQGGGGSALQQDNSIAYVNYFGKGTILRYTPMLSGMKEDIILAQYTGQNSFTFLLETNGLNLYEDQGQYYLAENHNAEAVFYLGQIEVYDAIGRPDLGTMTVETVVPGQRYRLTVSADEDFLTDPKTVYPVTIDPTLTVRDTEEVRGTLEDTPVYSYYPNGIFGNYVFNSIGFVSDHGIGKTAVRLTSLLTDTNYSQLTADQLNSVTFYIKGSGGYYQNVSIHALTENSTWTEMTLTWNTLGAYTETAYATKNMGGAAWNAFNITNLAKDWKNGVQNPQCGFVMVSDSTTSNVSFFSGEYGTIDYRPYVVVNYTNVITLDQTSATVDKGDTLTLSATTIPAGQIVTWESDAPTVASVSDTGVVTGLSKGTATITVTLDAETRASCTVEVLEKTISLNYNTSNNRAFVYEGDTVVITATTDPEGQTVTWASNATDVATVDDTGVVTARSPGVATITATLVGGTTAECKVEVLAKTISLNYNTGDNPATVRKGATVTIRATTAPEGEAVTWTSLNPSIATVENGVVTGHEVGVATIEAELSDGTCARCLVNVQPKVVRLNFAETIVYVGRTETLIATTEPHGEVVEWTSDNPNIATVSAYGVVRGIAVGNTIIRAKLEDGTCAVCAVEVKKTSITLNETSIEIDVGESFQLVATPAPLGLDVYWYSSNTSVATISSTGEVTGIAPGTATITVSIPDGTFTKCTVKVIGGITIEGESTYVVEGATLSLTATTVPANSAVTWSSSDESIATVDTNGVVTGVRAGMVAIIATMEGGSSATYIIYVTISDGVYYLHFPYETTDNYLQAELLKNSISNRVVLYPKASNNELVTTRIAQMWRITHIGVGQYTIRPLNNLDMCLGANSNIENGYRYVVNYCEEADTLDDVPLNAQWTIMWMDDGYALLAYGSTNRALTTSGGIEAHNVSVVVDAYSDTEPSFRWTLTPVANVPIGIALYDGNTGLPADTVPYTYVAPDETRNLRLLNYELFFFPDKSLANTIEYIVGNQNLASINDDGVILGIAPGNTKIFVYLNHSYTTEILEFPLTVTGISNGTYFLRNKTTGYYADIHSQIMENGRTIHQWEPHGGYTQKWTFTHLGDGTYTIYSQNSTSKYYLGVSGDSSAVDQPVVLRTGSITSGMKWVVEPTTDGAFKLIPKSGEATGCVLATTTSDATNGAILVQGKYVNNNSYRDEWIVHALVDYTLMFLGAQANDPAMIPITNYVNNSLLNAGHTGFSYNALSKNSALMYLSTSRVFACITHGSPTLMVTSDGYITVEDIAALDSNAFNDLAFIFLAACETGEGEGSSENLVNALYAKGAWAVLGFTRKVLVDETNYWSQVFMQNLANGMSYDDAMRAADNAIRAHDEFRGRKEYSVDTKYRHFVGNSFENPWE